MMTLHCDGESIDCERDPPVPIAAGCVPTLAGRAARGAVMLGHGLEMNINAGPLEWPWHLDGLVGEVSWPDLAAGRPLHVEERLQIGPDGQHLSDVTLSFDGELRPCIAYVIVQLSKSLVASPAAATTAARPRSLILVDDTDDGTVDAALGTAERLRDVDLLAVAAPTIRSVGRCGPYGNAITYVDHRVVDHEITVFARSTGERIATRRFRGRQQRCPSRVYAKTTTTYSGPPGNETPSDGRTEIRDIRDEPDQRAEVRWLGTLIAP